MKLLSRAFLSLLISLGLLTVTAANVYAATKTSGNLEVTFNEPIFPASTIWYPGRSVQGSITVKNKSAKAQRISFEAVNKDQTGNSTKVLSIKILEDGVNRYGGKNGKSLETFWNDGEIFISALAPGRSTTYDLIVEMETGADNSFQGKTAKFDLRVGFLGTPNQVIAPVGGVLGVAQIAGADQNVLPTPTEAPTPTPTIVIDRVLGATGENGGGKGGFGGLGGWLLGGGSLIILLSSGFLIYRRRHS